MQTTNFHNLESFKQNNVQLKSFKKLNKIIVFMVCVKMVFNFISKKSKNINTTTIKQKKSKKR